MTRLQYSSNADDMDHATRLWETRIAEGRARDARLRARVILATVVGTVAGVLGALWWMAHA